MIRIQTPIYSLGRDNLQKQQQITEKKNQHWHESSSGHPQECTLVVFLPSPPGFQNNTLVLFYSSSLGRTHWRVLISWLEIFIVKLIVTQSDGPSGFDTFWNKCQIKMFWSEPWVTEVNHLYPDQTFNPGLIFQWSHHLRRASRFNLHKIWPRCAVWTCTGLFHIAACICSSLQMWQHILMMIPCALYWGT